MGKIAVLDPHTIDQIAAGEVVERPSSVVKELVENAIDAGATAVTVEITDGGKKLIRITDNGSGLEAEEIPTAFMRHATSKLTRIEDLENIASLGFRGEALSSIASVSKVELITRTASAMAGTRYVIEGGREICMEEIGAPEGTTFLVRELFYNTPARLKFLKTDTTEAGYISTMMEQLALSHPEISFKYIQNRQVKLHTSGSSQVRDVIYAVYGREIAKALLPLTFKNDFMTIEGFAGKPEIGRGNRNYENYYINGRYVRNSILTKAIEDAYKGFLMQHKFPFVSVRIQMNGNDLDVNVHPAKREVRFSRGEEVYNALFQTVRDALTGRELIPQVPVTREEPVRKEAPLKREAAAEPFEVRRLHQEQADIVRQVRPDLQEETVPYGYHAREITISKEEQALSVQMLMEQEEEKTENPAILAKSIRELKEAAPEEKPMGPGPVFTRLEEDLFSGSLDSPKKPVPQPGESSPEPAPVPVQEEAFPPFVPDPALMGKGMDEAPAEKPEDPFTLEEKTESPVVCADMPREEALPRKEEKKPVAAPILHEQMELFTEELLTPQARPRHKLIGQIFDTYWLVEYMEKFYIIDQHAAHEKVNYERFVRQFRENEKNAQYLNPPMMVTISPKEEVLLEANRELFERIGFEIEPFGGREYKIGAVPTALYGFTHRELFLEMLDHLSEAGAADALEIFSMRLATMACKASVKGGMKLSVQEADALIDELLSCENPYHCPHGRPTIISMSRYELEKKFKRIV